MFENSAVPLAHPEHRLALAYAPRARREGLATLFALDARLGSLLRQSDDAMVSQMRLTWWFEALSRLDGAPPPAEPILQALASIVLPIDVSGARLAAMIDGWEELLAEDTLDTAALDRYSAARGGVLFAIAGQLLGGDESALPQLEIAGQGWALVDLARHVRDADVARRALASAQPRLEYAFSRRWPPMMRMLGALASLARADAGQEQQHLKPPGSPRRVSRMLWHRISGR